MLGKWQSYCCRVDVTRLWDAGERELLQRDNNNRMTWEFLHKLWEDWTGVLPHFSHLNGT